MAKRKARRLLVLGVATPEAISDEVVKRYTSKATTEVRTWSRNYVTGVTTYTADVTKQSSAKAKLAAWYNIYRTVIYPEVIKAYSRGKSEYIATAVRTATPAPTPPA
ncbi:MAG: hypothetical protein QXV82_08960 [Ignisphaera sp.]